ncbi:MAG TPA: efflux RND transporter periplasmic adaptor subunit [Steroidobacteraceae bacterium]|nr:efflux RND transporter periplasmic adaptor subunit [Steroidobacteraceae bacterium]
MSSRAWIAALIATALIAATGSYFFASHRMRTEAETSAPVSDREVLYWHDPMRPDVKFDKPGKSPFMDMQLVPVYANEVESSAVRIDPAAKQNLGIRIARVERRAIPVSLHAVGTIAFDERQTALVQSRVEGYIDRLYVKAPLEHVRQGQPIAEVVAPGWLAAEQEYLALLDVDSAQVRPIRDAARERLKVLGVPDATIREIERERKVKSTTTLTSPGTGVVSELNVREGAAVAAGAPIARISGLATVWVNAQIPEAEVAALTKAADVVATVTAWPGERFQGKVLGILPDVSEQTRTLTVRVALDNPDEKLAPGMFASLSFESDTDNKQLWVPSEAVIRTGRRDVVIVAGERGGFDPVNVEVGAERNGFIAINAGLEAGQSIVLSGQFLIDSEASLRSALDRLSPSSEAPNSAHTHSEGAHAP